MIKKIKKVSNVQVESAKLPRIKLQLFSDDGDDSGNKNPDDNPTNKEPEQDTPPKTEEKTFSQEDVNNIISQRLERERKKLEEDFESKLRTTIQEERKEAEKLAQMNEQEKQKHEIEKREKEIADRERAIQFKDLKFTAIDILNEKGLPIAIVDNLIAQDLDAERTKENIDTFEKAFREEVEKAVNERLKSNTPKTSSTKVTTSSSSADDFVKVIKENQIYNQK